MAACAILSRWRKNNEGTARTSTTATAQTAARTLCSARMCGPRKRAMRCIADAIPAFASACRAIIRSVAATWVGGARPFDRSGYKTPKTLFKCKVAQDTREPDPKHLELKHKTTRRTATHERTPDADLTLTHTHSHLPPRSVLRRSRTSENDVNQL